MTPPLMDHRDITGGGHVETPNRPPQPSEPGSPATAAVPLLLNPAYSRTKSLINDELRNFRMSLRWCALDHSSLAGKVISYISFLFLALLFPAATCLSIHVAAPETPSPRSTYQLVQLPESILAAISFSTLSCFFHRYGLRHLLFLDGLREDSSYVRRGYKLELDRAFRYLTYILLPSFSVELAHKIIFFSTVTVSAPYLPTPFPWNSVAFAASLASWVYRTGVFLLVCVLFRLTCELQILRFEGFRKLLEGSGSDAGIIFKEHVRIKKQLLITSHRYRIFIIGCLVTITISQLGALMLVLSAKSQKNFRNSGDLVVCSAVQLSGFFMCLLGAARITHRAQRIVSIATRWHMIKTCALTNCGESSSSSSSSRLSPGIKNNQQMQLPIQVMNDLLQLQAVSPNSVASSSSAYHSSSSESAARPPSQDNSGMETRKALVMYLQHNSGGITLFGFPLDRGLLHTLFAFEMSLVLWILSKAVVLS